MAADPRVLAFRDAVIRVLQARGVDIDADLEDRTDGPLLTLATAWCEERANQLAVIFQGALTGGST